MTCFVIIYICVEVDAATVSYLLEPFNSVYLWIFTVVAFIYLQTVNCFVLDKKYPFQLSPFVNTSLIRLSLNI